MTDAATDDIGTLLKRRREKLGYTLEKVSEKIRIRKIYLEHIEANNFADLPGKAYVKGFIDVYSRFLGLNSKELLATLATQDSQGVGSSETSPLAEQVDNQLNPAPKGKRQGAFLWVLLAVLAAGLTFFLLPNFLDDEATESMETPVAPQPVVEPVSNSVVLAPAVEEEKVEDEKPAAVDEPVVTEETPAVAEEKESPLPTISAQGSSLRMLALTKGSLIINVDQRKPRQYALHDGLDLTWKIKSEVSVELKPTAVARFWLDGVELDTAELQSFEMKTSPEE